MRGVTDEADKNTEELPYVRSAAEQGDGVNELIREISRAGPSY